MQESLEGLRDSKLKKVSNGDQDFARKVGDPLGKKTPLNRSPKIQPLCLEFVRAGVSALGPESLLPQGHLGALGWKNQMPGRRWAGDFASRARDSGHPKTSSNTNTKITITWASGLYFWWSWARWYHNNELYKYLHRNIIVQQWRIKPIEESFDLSIRYEPAKPSTWKTQ
jgi:hypothetical protein